MKTVAIFGWYGFDNAGDEAILSVLISFIKRSTPGVRIIVFSGDHKSTEIQYNVEAIDRSLHPKNWPSQLRAISQSDIVIIGGGGILHDLLFKSLPYYLGIAFLAKILRKRVMLYGVEVGPLTTLNGRFLARHIMNIIDIITVRDQDSYNLLKKIGVNRPPIILSSDPACILSCVDSKKVKKILHKEGIKKGEKPLIGVCMRTLPRWYNGKKYYSEIVENYENFKKIMAIALDELIIKLGVSIIFIPMRRQEDNKVAKEIIMNMNQKYNVYIIKGHYNAKEIKSLIGYMDIFIGMRLHSLIFASTMSIPIVGIKYADKILKYMEALGESNKVVDIGCTSLDNLLEIIECVFINKDNIKDKIAIKINHIKRKAQINNMQLLKLL